MHFSMCWKWIIQVSTIHIPISLKPPLQCEKSFCLFTLRNWSLWLMFLITTMKSHHRPLRILLSPHPTPFWKSWWLWLFSQEWLPFTWFANIIGCLMSPYSLPSLIPITVDTYLNHAYALDNSSICIAPLLSILTTTQKFFKFLVLT